QSTFVGREPRKPTSSSATASASRAASFSARRIVSFKFKNRRKISVTARSRIMPYRAATNNLWKSSPHRDLLHFDFSHQRCSCRRANSLLACHAVRPKRFFAALVPGFLLATHSYAQPTQLMIERN